MTNDVSKRGSKFLSLILRHRPEVIGLVLDENGWADTDELISKINTTDFQLDVDQLKAIVEQNDKKRFVFSPDFKKIRASQGHSVNIDLQLQQEVPPVTLYHGTAGKNLDSIALKGIMKGERQHVHLSADKETARKVGMRYGKPFVLTVLAKKMHDEGHVFFLSDNGVWLTEQVPVAYILLP